MQPQRMEYLDSVRGCAALAVVIGHSILAFWPKVGVYSAFRTVNSSPLALIWNGHSAVCLFFVLSGVVLSAGYFSSGRKLSSIVSSAFRRYPRLTIPILVSAILSYIILSRGLVYSSEVAYVSKSSWLGRYYTFEPSFLSSLRFGIFDVFFAYKPSESYVPPAWTMKIELYGSFIVFALLGLFGRTRVRFAAYAALLFLLWDTYYVGFVLGVGVSDFFLTPQKRPNFSIWVSLGVMAVGLILLSHTGRRDWLSLVVGDIGNKNISNFINMTGAFLLISALMACSALRRPLEAAPFIWLGKISFPLYLTHFIVMSSIGSWIYLLLTKDGANNMAALSAIGATTIASLLVAGITYHIIERPALAVSKAMGAFLKNNAPKTAQVSA